jgi:hypothetical protein
MTRHFSSATAQTLANEVFTYEWAKLDGHTWDKLDGHTWDKLDGHTWDKLDGHTWDKLDGHTWDKLETAFVPQRELLAA